MAQAWAMYTVAVTALSLAVLAAFALAGGGLYLLVKRRERKQGVLMLVAALVLFANVLIWTR
jgi:LPXTG-motif cell wall-anchored protein